MQSGLEHRAINRSHIPPTVQDHVQGRGVKSRPGQPLRKSLNARPAWPDGNGRHCSPNASRVHCRPSVRLADRRTSEIGCHGVRPHQRNKSPARHSVRPTAQARPADARRGPPDHAATYHVPQIQPICISPASRAASQSCQEPCSTNATGADSRSASRRAMARQAGEELDAWHEASRMSAMIQSGLLRAGFGRSPHPRWPLTTPLCANP